jgi:hypothetical protein
MANLGMFNIDTEKEWVTLSEATELTLVKDTTYIIQNLSNTPFMLREGTTAGGFIINNTARVPFTQGDDDLYIRTHVGKVTLNIAD